MPRETAEAKLVRMTQIEEALWAEGVVVAGIDEVGRGPLAGPVYAACAIIPRDALVPGVDDSKKLSEKKREALYDRLMERATYAKVGVVTEREIDGMGIVNATRRAMELAAAEAKDAFFLIDAVENLQLPGECRSIIHGDALSYMIAAASIIAKVERDRYMLTLDALYPDYGFARNKGYGTAEHIRALREIGPCPAHRRSFIGNFCPEGDK